MGIERCRPSRGCGVFRREFLHVGGLTAFGIGLAERIAWGADGSGAKGAIGASVRTGDRGVGAARPARARSCILIWLDGGPSHLDTFDLKPDAPAEVRGPMSPIATRVPGVTFCELLSRTAELAGEMAIIRSMTSPLGEHNFASHYLLSGYPPTPALTYPGMPAVVSHLGGPASGALPTNIAVGDPNAMLGAGYLADSSNAFVIDADPARPDFRVRDLDPAEGIGRRRLDRRRRFRIAVDRLAATRESSGTSVDRGQRHRDEGHGGAPPATVSESALDEAFRLIHSSEARAAFELENEPESTRQRYGRHRLGQSCLLARRLCEAGTGFVTVTDRGWDTHAALYRQLKEGFTGGTAGRIPLLDQAYSALLTDLRDRGLLESTLVILMGEFGRTPKLNPQGGRDHWPRVFSVVLAGAGIPGGQIIGSSDRRGESPQDRPVTPADLVHTIYRLLGIDPGRLLQTADGRPVRINRDGSTIDELIG